MEKPKVSDIQDVKADSSSVSRSKSRSVSSDIKHGKYIITIWEYWYTLLEHFFVFLLEHFFKNV